MLIEIEEQKVATLKKMWECSEYGDTFESFGIYGHEADASGWFDPSVKTKPKYYQEILYKLEVEMKYFWGGQWVQLGVIGNYYSWMYGVTLPVNWGIWWSAEKAYLEHEAQWRLTRILIEHSRTKWFLSQLYLVKEECEKRGYCTSKEEKAVETEKNESNNK